MTEEKFAKSVNCDTHRSLHMLLRINRMNKLEDFEVNGEEEENANDKTSEIVEMKMCLSVTLSVKSHCHFCKYLLKTFLPLFTEGGEWRWRIFSWLSTVQINYRPICHNEEQ